MVQLQKMSEAAREATAAAQRKVSTSASIKPKVDTLQTKLSNDNRIGDATRKAQQALSEKYGIPTFDTQGFISTVPQTRPIDTNINVGTGAFTKDAFNRSISYLTSQVQQNISGGGAGFIDTIGGAITSIIDTLFPKQDLSDLTEEQKAKIKDFDDKIAALTRDLEHHRRNLAGGLDSTFAYQEVRQKIEELERGKTELLRRYRMSNTLLKSINEQIDLLNKLAKTEIVTKAIKDEVSRELQNASALIEQKLQQNLEISKEVITNLNKSMLAAADILKVTVKEEQEEVREQIQEQFDLWKTLSNLGKPSIKEKIAEYIDDYRAQRGAIDVLVSTGEFSAKGVKV